jgi:hypothetical protein
MDKTAGMARIAARADADRDKVAVNPHRGRAAGRLVRPLDKLALAVDRAVAHPANRQVEQVAVLRCPLQRNTAPAGVVVDEHSSHQ